MTQNLLHIAVLDTKVFLNTIDASSESDKIDFSNCSKHGRITHGTICYAIIQDYIQRYNIDVTLSCLPVLNHNCKGNVASLIDAIHWCQDNGIDIINLSLGTREYNEFEKISNQINEAYYKHGIIFVCAGSNNGKLSFPSYLTNVIGVNTRPGLSEGYLDLAPLNDLGINITSCSEHLLHINNLVIKTHANNSFAAPFVTAKIAELLSQTRCSHKVEDILLKLCGRDPICPMHSRLDWLYNAIIIDNNLDFAYNFPSIISDSMDEYTNLINQSTQAIISIKDKINNCNELTRLSIYKRTGSKFIPFTYMVNSTLKTEFFAMLEDEDQPVVISIVADSIDNSEALFNRIRDLLKFEQFRVYTIIHNIRNLLNGEGFITDVSIYTADLHVKIKNSLIDIILLDECGYGEDLSIYINKMRDSNKYEIVYNIFGKQNKITVSQENIYNGSYLTQLIIDLLS